MFLLLSLKPGLRALVLTEVAGTMPAGARRLGAVRAALAAPLHLPVWPLTAARNRIEGGPLIAAEGVAKLFSKAVAVALEDLLDGHGYCPHTTRNFVSRPLMRRSVSFWA